jgi:hypothetical protein
MLLVCVPPTLYNPSKPLLLAVRAACSGILEHPIVYVVLSLRFAQHPCCTALYRPVPPLLYCLQAAAAVLQVQCS